MQNDKHSIQSMQYYMLKNLTPCSLFMFVNNNVTWSGHCGITVRVYHMVSFGQFILNTDITYQFYKHVWLRLELVAIPRIYTDCGNLDVISRKKHQLVMDALVKKIVRLVAI